MALLLALFSLPAFAQLKINEVFYSAVPQGGNQYVELYNSGGATAFLDGMLLTDAVGFFDPLFPSDTEGVFQFPGLPGESNHPVPPGGFVTIAVDATGATTNADWECYAGGTDPDNPSVPNLTLIHGSVDLSLNSGQDNVILLDGTDTNLPLDTATVVDGMNYGSGVHFETAPLSASVLTDADDDIIAASGESLQRCPDGMDSDVASASDFLSFSMTPGAPNTGCAGFPTLVVSDPSVVEGDAGTVNASFSVTLTPASASTVTVHFATANGSATAGSDYVTLEKTNMLTFAPGVTLDSISVAVLGDTDTEGNEDFFVNLSSPSNAIIATPQAAGNIIDDEGGAAFVFISDVEVLEGDAGTVDATFSVTLSLAPGPDVSVNYQTSNGTGAAGSDYVAQGPTLLVFSGAVVSQDVTVTVNGDVELEPNETFFVNLSEATNAIIADAQGQGGIIDDEDFSLTSITLTQGVVTVGWEAANTIQFQAEYTTNLVSPNWQSVNGIISATTTNASVTDSGSSTTDERHYRVLKLN